MVYGRLDSILDSNSIPLIDFSSSITRPKITTHSTNDAAKAKDFNAEPYTELYVHMICSI
jgi:hypothetical protein